MSEEAIAFVFPGQGSQFVGMGRELATFPEARQVFAQADEVLGLSLSRLCFEGPEAELNDTLNTQPAIVTHSIAVLRALESRTDLRERLRMVAGHSLGEFSALVCAGVLSFPDAIKLVRERGRLMKLAGEQHPGGMAAVLNLDRAKLETACDEAVQATDQPVQIANDNCPGQIVISGDKAALAKAMELAKAQGAKRCVPLPISIAAHSPLMSGAAQEFRAALESVRWAESSLPVIANATARPAGRDVIQLLVAQLTSPVRWTESVQFMIGKGITRFVEVGPKDVLCGLIKRIDAAITAQPVGSVIGNP